MAPETGRPISGWRSTAPAFAVMSTAVGLRVLKDHWGPIKRHEVELVPEVDDLLLKIQELVEVGGSSEIA